jgi:large subunit ribosomal protein L14e
MGELDLRSPVKKFETGDLAIVRRGRFAGKLFAVVKTEGESRVLIADGVNYRADRPKKKNIKHLQGTLMSLKDVAEKAASGKPIDNGWLAERIAEAHKSGASCKRGG